MNAREAQEAMREGRLEDARELLLGITRTREDSPEIRYNLAMVLVRLRDYAGAAEQFQNCLVAAPGNPDILNNLGNCLRLSGQYRAAREVFDDGLRASPNHAGLLANSGWLHLVMDQPEQARKCFEQVIAGNNESVDAHRGLAEALSRNGHHQRALQGLETAARRFPDSATLLQSQGALYARLRRPGLALECLEKALELEPGNPETLLNHGICAEQVGDLKAAETSFQRALVARPGFPAAHFHLAHLAVHQPDANEIASIEAALADEPQGQALIDLEFALGKSLARIGRHAAAFKAFIRGRQAMADRSPFDIEMTLSRIRQIGALPHKVAPPEPTSLIFIAGLPRSGTTLVDQILDSHPGARSLGESGLVQRLLQGYSKLLGHPYGAKATALTEAQRTALAEGLRRDLPSDGRVTVDATPGNLLYLGLLAELLPEAKFIYCLRDSRDTCVSIIEQPLTGAHGYANRLEDLGRYCRASFRIGTHWTETLGNRLHRVHYEELTSEPEATIDKVLTACQLPPDAACLDFHLNRRAVITPSAAQVRQPMSTRSIGRWRHYREFLDPLLRELPQTTFYTP